MKKEKTKKAPAPQAEQDPKKIKRAMILELILAAVLLIAGFTLRFGAFTLFGGGCLLLALTNYILLKGTPKSRKDANAKPPSDSLPPR